MKYDSDADWRTLPAKMRPPIPAEVALWAFFEEHRRCGELDAGVGACWMTCESGRMLVRDVLRLPNGKLGRR